MLSPLLLPAHPSFDLLLPELHWTVSFTLSPVLFSSMLLLTVKSSDERPTMRQQQIRNANGIRCHEQRVHRGTTQDCKRESKRSDYKLNTRNTSVFFKKAFLTRDENSSDEVAVIIQLILRELCWPRGCDRDVLFLSLFEILLSLFSCSLARLLAYHFSFARSHTKGCTAFTVDICIVSVLRHSVAFSISSSNESSSSIAATEAEAEAAVATAAGSITRGFLHPFPCAASLWSDRNRCCSQVCACCQTRKQQQQQQLRVVCSDRLLWLSGFYNCG